MSFPPPTGQGGLPPQNQMAATNSCLQDEAESRLLELRKNYQIQKWKNPQNTELHAKLLNEIQYYERFVNSSNKRSPFAASPTSNPGAAFGFATFPAPSSNMNQTFQANTNAGISSQKNLSLSATSLDEFEDDFINLNEEEKEQMINSMQIDENQDEDKSWEMVGDNIPSEPSNAQKASNSSNPLTTFLKKIPFNPNKHQQQPQMKAEHPKMLSSPPQNLVLNYSANNNNIFPTNQIANSNSFTNLMANNNNNGIFNTNSSSTKNTNEKIKEEMKNANKIISEFKKALPPPPPPIKLPQNAPNSFPGSGNDSNYFDFIVDNPPRTEIEDTIQKAVREPDNAEKIHEKEFKDDESSDDDEAYSVSSSDEEFEQNVSYPNLTEENSGEIEAKNLQKNNQISKNLKKPPTKKELEKDMKKADKLIKKNNRKVIIWNKKAQQKMETLQKKLDLMQIPSDLFVQPLTEEEIARNEEAEKEVEARMQEQHTQSTDNDNFFRSHTMRQSVSILKDETLFDKLMDNFQNNDSQQVFRQPKQQVLSEDGTGDEDIKKILNQIDKDVSSAMIPPMESEENFISDSNAFSNRDIVVREMENLEKQIEISKKNQKPLNESLFFARNNDPHAQKKPQIHNFLINSKEIREEFKKLVTQMSECYQTHLPYSKYNLDNPEYNADFTKDTIVSETEDKLHNRIVSKFSSGRVVVTSLSYAESNQKIAYPNGVIFSQTGGKLPVFANRANALATKTPVSKKIVPLEREEVYNKKFSIFSIDFKDCLAPRLVFYLGLKYLSKNFDFSRNNVIKKSSEHPEFLKNNKIAKIGIWIKKKTRVLVYENGIQEYAYRFFFHFF